MEQDLCGPGWASLTKTGVVADRFTQSPVDVGCCAAGDYYVQGLGLAKPSECFKCAVGEYHKANAQGAQGGFDCWSVVVGLEPCAVGEYRKSEGAECTAVVETSESGLKVATATGLKVGTETSVCGPMTIWNSKYKRCDRCTQIYDPNYKTCDRCADWNPHRTAACDR